MRRGRVLGAAQCFYYPLRVSLFPTEGSAIWPKDEVYWSVIIYDPHVMNGLDWLCGTLADCGKFLQVKLPPALTLF